MKMILLKVIIYLTVIAFVTSLPTPNVTTPPCSQVKMIKQASSGIDSSSRKANLFMTGTCITAKVGMKGTSKYLMEKGFRHIDDWNEHAKTLRNAVERTDTNNRFGGAKTKKELDKVIKKGKEKLIEYDSP